MYVRLFGVAAECRVAEGRSWLHVTVMLLACCFLFELAFRVSVKAVALSFTVCDCLFRVVSQSTTFFRSRLVLTRSMLKQARYSP